MSQRVGHTSDEAVRIVYETPWLALGEFHCEPEDRRWSEENRADEGHFVVFPGTPVRIAQDGHDPVVATPNNVMFYNRHQTYRRALVSARGDHCVFVLLSPQALEEVARAFVPELKDPEIAPFPFSNGPCAAGTYLAHRMLLHHLYSAPAPDELFVEECLYGLVGDAVIRSFGTAQRNEGPRRSTTRAAHAEMVEEAKLVLSARLRDRLTMEELAATLFTSPFHLARVFRQRTGFSMHAFRTQLRLRSSLGPVCDTHPSLTDIAADLGFSSLSHFSDSFRRVFGLPPSIARARSRSGSGSRRILEATTRLAM
jgi:AraC family transcriptional regulator